MLNNDQTTWLLLAAIVHNLVCYTRFQQSKWMKFDTHTYSQLVILTQNGLPLTLK